MVALCCFLRLCLVAITVTLINGEKACGVDDAFEYKPGHCFIAKKVDQLPNPEKAGEQCPSSHVNCTLPKVDSDEKLDTLVKAIQKLRPDAIAYVFWLGLKRKNPETEEEWKKDEMWSEPSKWLWADGTAMKSLTNVAIEFKNEQAKVAKNPINETCVIFSRKMNGTESSIEWLDAPCPNTYKPDNTDSALLLVLELQSSEPESSPTTTSAEVQQETTSSMPTLTVTQSGSVPHLPSVEPQPSNDSTQDINVGTTSKPPKRKSSSNWIWITVGVCLAVLSLIAIGVFFFMRRRRRRRKPQAMSGETNVVKKQASGSSTTAEATESTGDDDGSNDPDHRSHISHRSQKESGSGSGEAQPYTYVRLAPKTYGEDSVRKVYMSEVHAPKGTTSGAPDMQAPKGTTSGAPDMQAPKGTTPGAPDMQAPTKGTTPSAPGMQAPKVATPGEGQPNPERKATGSMMVSLAPKGAPNEAQVKKASTKSAVP